MAYGGRVAFWLCLLIGIGCFGYALYIVFASLSLPPDDPLDAISPFAWLSANMAGAIVMMFAGAVVILIGWALRAMLED